MVGTVVATTSSSWGSLPWDWNATALAISPTTRRAAAVMRIFLRERVDEGLSTSSLGSHGAVSSSDSSAAGGAEGLSGIVAARTVAPVSPEVSASSSVKSKWLGSSSTTTGTSSTSETVGPVGSGEANGMPRFAETSKPQDRQKRPSAISPHEGHPESAPHDRQNLFDSGLLHDQHTSLILTATFFDPPRSNRTKASHRHDRMATAQ